MSNLFTEVATIVGFIVLLFISGTILYFWFPLLICENEKKDGYKEDKCKRMKNNSIIINIPALLFYSFVLTIVIAVIVYLMTGIIILKYQFAETLDD